ncbi:MAG: S49 family peptidase [Pseudomonadales bacterium]|nr:S49 family peptidase [Pseudomonadales bacterium]
MMMTTAVEQRRARRWSVFFKLLTFGYLFGVGYLLMNGDSKLPSSPSKSHTAVVDVYGVIADGQEASADNIVQGLREAFENDAAKAIILRINSPGGSAVHSDYVFAEIKRLQVLYPKKLYAVISDIGASGGYYIAAAADEIYANPASIVGSIGVRLGGGFGFEKLMKKIGVERRMLTAGEHKALLDPFSPLKEGEMRHMQRMLDGVHQQFIMRVKDGRGERLKPDPKIFSGLFWNGSDAKDLGLIDGFSSAGAVARDKIGVEEIVDYTVRPSPVEQLMERMGVAVAEALAMRLGVGSHRSIESRL